MQFVPLWMTYPNFALRDTTPIAEASMVCMAITEFDGINRSLQRVHFNKRTPIVAYMSGGSRVNDPFSCFFFLFFFMAQATQSRLLK